MSATPRTICDIGSGDPSASVDREQPGRLLQLERILEHVPDGVVVLSAEQTIQWANRQFCGWAQRENVERLDFYDSLNRPEILGPDYCPFNTALKTQQACTTVLRTERGRFYHVHVVPVRLELSHSAELIVTVRDVTEQRQQQQKLEAIHKAGIELASLKPGEVGELTMRDRVDLLRSNILHYTQDLLKFDVVEIRLLDQVTGSLTPLLSVGLDQEASERPLWARPNGNGVTGYVASTGKSYLCEDTTHDPLYITGFQGAKSSMTVPLLLHEQVIGTFNVESPQTRAFTENDLQFVEIFSRDVAAALNTLDLLVAQTANTAQQSVTAIHQAVAQPVDEILHEAVSVLERLLQDESQVKEGLQRITTLARDIKQVIQNVGQTIAPAPVAPAPQGVAERPKLVGVRVLVVDESEEVRLDAHRLLERYGCVVETARDGEAAAGMVRLGGKYDAVISDIRLPDMSGFGLMCKLRELINPLPLILMTGFGWDSGHVIVKARQAGLHPKGILYKPFRLEQLLSTVETIVDWTRAGSPAGVVGPEASGGAGPGTAGPGTAGPGTAGPGTAGLAGAPGMPGPDSPGMGS